MTGKQLEKILKNQLADYFKEKNYKFSHEYENTYYTKKESLYDIKLEVQSKSSSIGYADFNFLVRVIIITSPRIYRTWGKLAICPTAQLLKLQ